MKKEFQNLWLNKQSSQGKINLTIFFINLFLLLSHTFLMIIYIIIGYRFMITANMISLLIYNFYFKRCYKNIRNYAAVASIEIWLHMIFAILSFGWAVSYQNWCFALVTAYFLPAFNTSEKRAYNKTPIIFSIIVILTYFFLAVICAAIANETKIIIDPSIKRILFTANNLFSFFAIVMFALFFTLKSKRKEYELSRQADYDELTGIYNRYALNQINEDILTEAEMLNKPYNIAILDIDFFKKVNDKYGHNTGDIVLKDIAKILTIYTDTGVIVGRWGGEEFVLMAPCTMTYNEFKTILRKLKTRISKFKFTTEDNRDLNITVSIGASSINDYKTIEEAISLADDNLYEAKKAGRNRVIA